MTPIEIRIKCIELANDFHLAAMPDRESKVLTSAKKVLDFVTDNGTLSDVSAEDITMSALSGLVGMISELSALNDAKESSTPVPEEAKAEKKAKSVKTTAEDKPEA